MNKLQPLSLALVHVLFCVARELSKCNKIVDTEGDFVSGFFFLIRIHMVTNGLNACGSFVSASSAEIYRYIGHTIASSGERLTTKICPVF